MPTAASRTASDHDLRDIAREAVTAMEAILADATAKVRGAEDGWNGRTGFVHRAAMADDPDMSGHQAYACGAPVVVDACRSDFIGHCGLPRDEFYADSFTTAADLAAIDQGAPSSPR